MKCLHRSIGLKAEANLSVLSKLKKEKSVRGERFDVPDYDVLVLSWTKIVK